MFKSKWSFIRKKSKYTLNGYWKGTTHTFKYHPSIFKTTCLFIRSIFKKKRLIRERKITNINEIIKTKTLYF